MNVIVVIISSNVWNQRTNTILNMYVYILDIMYNSIKSINSTNDKKKTNQTNFIIIDIKTINNNGNEECE